MPPVNNYRYIFQLRTYVAQIMTLGTIMLYMLSSYNAFIIIEKIWLLCKLTVSG